MSELRALLTPEGLELLDALGPIEQGADVARAVSRLRAAGHSPDLVSAVVGQAALRSRGQAKFGDFAAGMLFTPAGLEQATRLEVAAHHARRYRDAGLARVADLTCGIGADAMAFAGVFADLVLEVVQLGVDRPRPEEALGAEAQRSHGRHWSHIPSFPSGHLIVTTALAVAAATMAPILRVPAFAYLVAIAATRITFGSHFPLDVVLGTIVGWQVGLFAVALTRAARLLPQPDRIAADRRTAVAINTPIAIPNPAPASTSERQLKPSTRAPGTSPASAALAAGTTIRSCPARTAAMTAGRMPRTGRSAPSRPSSARKTVRPVAGTSPAACRALITMARSKRDPRLGSVAGVR